MLPPRRWAAAVAERHCTLPLTPSVLHAPVFFEGLRPPLRDVVVRRRPPQNKTTLYSGPNQGPGLFHGARGPHVRAPGGARATRISTRHAWMTAPYLHGGESFNGVLERHLRQVELCCEAATSRRIQFKLDKSRPGWPRIPIPGFCNWRGSHDRPPRHGTSPAWLAGAHMPRGRRLAQGIRQLLAGNHSPPLRTGAAPATATTNGIKWHGWAKALGGWRRSER